MHHIRKGTGAPLLLIHGLGGSARSWDTVIEALAAEREIIAVDLPGFGATPPLAGEASIRTLADAVADFLATHDLKGIPAVGSSMGARLVLELARRGEVGATVALDPGGFWNSRERAFFGASVGLSIQAIRLLAPVMPLITGNPLTRTLLFAQFSARPWKLPSGIALQEMRSFAASRSFDEVLGQLVEGPAQAGPEPGAATPPVVIGWGRRDLVCLPRQAQRALRRFPAARLVWFERSGHFPHWDAPEETIRLILASAR